ncbi:MAG: PHP domain-containing protein [Treponema sp.]|nr:PHP domain-containing protein [Treponema sp.]
MNAYKYETHLHTSQASACAHSEGKEYIKPFFDAGYSGIFVTDHFFGGNTCIPRNADWETRIKQYCSGYKDALKAAEEFNKKNKLTGTDREFKVFFGIEQTFNGDDYLIYGLDKQWLLNHPEIETIRHAELFEIVEKANGLIIQAHPFRLRDYIKAIHLHPRDVHGVEIYNAGNKSSENDLAEIYAKQYDFPVTSGSDIHSIDFIPDAPGKLKIGGMSFDTPLKDVFDYAERIKFNRGQIIR